MDIKYVSSIGGFIIKVIPFIVIICTVKEFVTSLNVTKYHHVQGDSSQNHNQLLNEIQLNTNYLTNTESMQSSVKKDDLSGDSTVNIDRKDLNHSNYNISTSNTTIQYHNTSAVTSTNASSELTEVGNNSNSNNNNNNNNNNGSTHSVAQQTTDKNNYKTDRVNNKHFKLQNEQTISMNSSIKFMRYNTGDTIHLKCRIPKGPYLVLWNKLGLDYPLTIGRNRFIPDKRFQIQHKPPNRWNLIISNAQLNDTGVYSCSPGAGIKDNHASVDKKSDLKQYHEYQMQSEKKKKNNYKTHTTITDTTTLRTTTTSPRKPNKGREYYVSVAITVTGPNLVFYGTPLELICRASFPSSEAKLDPTISLEWYHRGIRRLSHPFRSGGVYITMQWLDSHLLESRLFIAWATEAEAGQWICLERSTNPTRNLTSAKLTSSSTSTLSNYPNIHQMNEYSRASFLSYPPNISSVTYNPSKIDFVYDKIYIEIIAPTALSSSSQTNALLSTTLSSSSSSSSSPSSTSFTSSFNRKLTKPNTLIAASKHSNGKPEKLSFIERLIRSMNQCSRLQINKQLLFMFNLFNCLRWSTFLMTTNNHIQ
ncbi:unnamed protein product [Schistosoma turkestanicum]|nr:unnamed protein product [Schistosoma turkestanicum]